MLDRSILAAYRLGARMVLNNPDQGEWIHERIRRPQTLLAAAMNAAYFKLKRPRIWGAISVQIEPVYGCNLKCRYCWWGSGETHSNRPRLLSQEIFRRAVDGLPDTVESVIFSLLGEPLLHPNLGDMIEYVHRKGRRAIMYTNGTKLTGDRLRMVAESKLSVVNVSIEPDAETARENRGVDLDQIRANVRELHRIKRPEMQIKASCVVAANNVDRLEQISAYWDGLISKFKFAPCLCQVDEEQPSMCLEMWRGNFNILTSGDVCLCCFDPEPEMLVGNVLETDLPAIVNGPPMRRILANTIAGKPPARCLGCREFRTSLASPRAPRLSP